MVRIVDRLWVLLSLCFGLLRRGHNLHRFSHLSPVALVRGQTGHIYIGGKAETEVRLYPPSSFLSPLFLQSPMFQRITKAKVAVTADR